MGLYMGLLEVALRVCLTFCCKNSCFCNVYTFAVCFCFVYAHFYGCFLKLKCYFDISAFLFVAKLLIIRFSAAYMSDYYRLTFILL